MDAASAPPQPASPSPAVLAAAHRIRTALVDLSLGGGDTETAFRTLCESLVAAGAPLDRVLVGTDVLHPIVDGRSLVWRAEDGAVETRESERNIDWTQDEGWLVSPFYHLVQTGQRVVRRRLFMDEGLTEFPVLQEFKAAGATDYIAFRFALGSAANLGVVEDIVGSFTARDPAGFSADHVALIEAVLPDFVVTYNAMNAVTTARLLLNIYLGSEATRRVLAGNVVRGRAEPICAAIWYSDLEGFTRTTERAAQDQVLAFLNEYAGAQVDAIHAAGGHVLKFIGDGILAIFTAADDATECACALAAAKEVRARIDALNASRSAAGLPVTDLRLALHHGDVMFGNYGAHDRLDFTVVGPAVNEASRIEAMCRSLGQWLLTSAAFQRAAGPGAASLVSTGRYALRGVAAPQELFTLDAS